MKKWEIQEIVIMIILTSSSERMFNLIRYAGHIMMQLPQQIIIVSISMERNFLLRFRSVCPAMTREVAVLELIFLRLKQWQKML